MNKAAEQTGHWSASWEESRRQFLEGVMRATPAQRLAWLEEVLELAHRSGALDAMLKR